MKQRKLRKKECKEITQNARKFPRKLRIVESLNQDFSPLALLTFGFTVVENCTVPYRIFSRTLVCIHLASNMSTLVTTKNISDIVNSP